MCENMHERWWERERKTEANSFGWAGFIVHRHYQKVINSARTLFYFNYRHKALYLYIYMCVWTEMECEWCLFGHGSKPDGKVWVIAAVGDDIISIHTHVLTHTCVCDCQYYSLTGRGAHATLVTECRVLPSSVSCSGLVMGTKHAHMSKLTGKHLCLKQGGYRRLVPVWFYFLFLFYCIWTLYCMRYLCK